MKSRYNPSPIRKTKTHKIKSVISENSKLLKLTALNFSNRVKIFSRQNWSFVLIKQNKIIYKSKLDGLKPLIQCIRKHRKEMRNAVVCDKIIGKAAAILLASAGVREVWTPLISRAGKNYFSQKGVKVVFIKEVENIINRKGDDICPMEKLSNKIGDKEFIKIMLG